MDQTLSQGDSVESDTGYRQLGIPAPTLSAFSAFGTSVPQDQHQPQPEQHFQHQAHLLQLQPASSSSQQPFHDLSSSPSGSDVAASTEGGRAGGGGGMKPAPPATSYQQQLVQQYHQQQQEQQQQQQQSLPETPLQYDSSSSIDTLAPSSHLPALFHASSASTHPLAIPIPDHAHFQQQQQSTQPGDNADGSIASAGDFGSSATSQKIMMWQNGMSSGSLQHDDQSQPRLLTAGSGPPLAASGSFQRLSQQTSSSASPIDEKQLQRNYQTDSASVPNAFANPAWRQSGPTGIEDSARPRSLTFSSAQQAGPPKPEGSTAVAPVTSSTGANASAPLLSQFVRPAPPAQRSAPHVLHFHPPPMATANIAFSLYAQPSSRGDSPGPRTIDLNPAATASRHRGFDPSSLQRTDPSGLSLSTPQRSLAQQVQHSGQQSTPQRLGGTAPGISWENEVATATTGTAPSAASASASTYASVSSTPMRNAHARFQSASNVRGAPTEAFDGSPAKFFWDSHARMTTMDSIASSQWSPAVNDMYRFVDPLRPNFDFSATLDGSSISSPLEQHRQLSLGQDRSRLASFTSDADTVPLQHMPSSSSLPSDKSNSAAPSLQQRSQSTGQFQQPSTSFTPTETRWILQHADAQAQRQYPHLHHLQPGSQQAYMSQQGRLSRLQSDDDPESRRASTATTISSAPLVSPPDYQTDLPNISQQLSAPLTRLHFEDPLSQYMLQEPPNPYGYRDYFNDSYKPSPPSMTHTLPSHPDYSMPEVASSLPVTAPPPLNDISQAGQPSSMPAEKFYYSGSIELPIAQIAQQTLREELYGGKSGPEDVKRKRTSSKKGSISAMPDSQFRPVAGQGGQTANETLAPADDRARRRLSSPVLSVRPNDSADGQAFSDDDDDDDEPQETLQSEQTVQSARASRNGVLYGSLFDSGLTAQRTDSASGQLEPSVYVSVPVTASSSSGSTYQSVIVDNQPAHPIPTPVDTSGLVRALPDEVEDPDLGAPRRQKLRFGDDWYTPEWVRGESAKKEGFCDLCQPGKWLQLKNSAFWYHRQYTHGISSVSGQPFVNPVSFRQAENEGSTEALCHQCNEWVMYTSRKQNAAEDPAARIPTNWFKHAHKCHFYVANRSKNDKPRGKRRKISSSPDDG